MTTHCWGRLESNTRNAFLKRKRWFPKEIKTLLHLIFIRWEWQKAVSHFNSSNAPKTISSQIESEAWFAWSLPWQSCFPEHFPSCRCKRSNSVNRRRRSRGLASNLPRRSFRDRGTQTPLTRVLASSEVTKEKKRNCGWSMRDSIRFNWVGA